MNGPTDASYAEPKTAGSSVGPNKTASATRGSVRSNTMRNTDSARSELPAPSLPAIAGMSASPSAAGRYSSISAPLTATAYAPSAASVAMKPVDLVGARKVTKFDRLPTRAQQAEMNRSHEHFEIGTRHADALKRGDTGQRGPNAHRQRPEEGSARHRETRPRIRHRKKRGVPTMARAAVWIAICCQNRLQPSRNPHPASNSATATPPKASRNNSTGPTPLGLMSPRSHSPPHATRKDRAARPTKATVLARSAGLSSGRRAQPRPKRLEGSRLRQHVR